MNHAPPKMRSSSRRGLSMLEVLLSVAILGVSLAAIGQLYNVGYRSALQVRFRSDANLIVDSVMAELAAGVLPLDSSSGQVPDNPDWVYEVDVQTSDIPGLLIAEVTAARIAGNRERSISIVRLIPDPEFDPTEEEQ